MTLAEKNNWKEAFCASVALTIALVIYLVWHIDNGYWISMTVGLMFLATDQGQGAIVMKARDRAIGTIIGLCLAFIFVSDLMYFSYRWAYFLPIVMFIGTYLFYATNNYAFWTMTITMLVAICASSTIPTEFSIGGVLFIRFFCTYAGIVIALICEFIFFKEAASIKPTLELQLKNYFMSQSEIIRLSTEEFIKDEKNKDTFSEEFASKIWKHITEMTSIESNFVFKTFEFGKKKDQFDYSLFFSSVSEISTLSRKILSIAAHDENKKSDEEKEIITNLTQIVCKMYSYIQEEKRLTIEAQNKVNDLICRTKAIKDIRPSTFLFCNILCQMANVFTLKRFEI